MTIPDAVLSDDEQVESKNISFSLLFSQKESSNLDIKLRKLNKRQKTLTEKEKEALVESVLGKHFSRAQIRCYVRGNWQVNVLATVFGTR